MNNKKVSNNSLGTGFLLGVIVGFIFTFLFVTKKGREILKEITDKGLNHIDDLEKLLQQKEKEFEEMDEETEEEDYLHKNEEQKKQETHLIAYEAEVNNAQPKEEVNTLKREVGPKKDYVEKGGSQKLEKEGTITKAKKTARKFFRRK